MEKKIAWMVLLFLGGGLFGADVKIRLGANLSRYSSPEPVLGITFSSHLGLAAAVGLEFALSERISMEAGLMLGSKGSGVKVVYPSTPLMAVYHLSILSVPVVGKYRFFSGRSTYLLLGGQFDFILSHRMVFATSGEEVDLADQTKGLDLGFVFGLGQEFQLGKVHLLVEGRYQAGLNNLLQEGAENEKIKLRGWLWLVGLGIPLK